MLFLASGDASAFQERPVVVTHSSQLRTTVKPGERLNVAFLVRNTTPQSVRLTPEVSFPAAWRLVLAANPFTATPGVAQLKTVILTVPSSSAPGSYSIAYRVTAPGDPTVFAEDSVAVVVEAVRSVDMVLAESPAFVSAGNDIISRFLITNTGNTTGQFLLRTVTNFGVASVSDSGGIRLASGESKVVEMRLPTVKSDRVQPQHVLQLEARCAEQPEILARTTSMVEVIPVPLDGMLHYHEFPGRVAGIVAGEEDRVGGQLEVSGYGTLFDGRDEELELLLRGPDNQRKSTLGKRDEYRITLESISNQYRLLLGDQTYRLTPLTEFGRYSFGAGLEGTLGSLSGTVFAHETRLTTPRERQIGLGALYDVVSWAGVGAHYLGKSGPQSSTIVGVRSILRPTQDHTVDLEFAQSQSSGSSDPGFSARSYGRTSWLRYDLQYIRGEPQFTGYFRDMQFISAGATVIPVRDLFIQGNVRFDERNIDLNPALPFAPAERFYLAGVGYGSFASLYFRSLTQWDRLGGRAYDRKEDIAQLRLAWTVPRISLVTLFDYGRKEDRKLGRSTPYSKAALYSSYSPTMLLRLGAWLEYTSDRNLVIDAKIDRYSGGASVGYTPWPSTQTLLSFYASRTTSTFRSTNMFVEGLVIQDLPWGHRIIAQARYTYFNPAAKQYVFAFALEYGIPLAVPLGRKRDVGRMIGRLTDAETGEGVAGALLRTDGTAALTDETGAFMFPGLAPGEYPVEIDRATIGLDRAPAQPMPALMTVEGGEIGTIDLSVVRLGSISGHVTEYGYRDAVQVSDTVLVEVGGRAGVVMELVSARGELQRRLTNSRGEFRFPDVLPGQFILRIEPESVPSSYRRSPDSLVVLVAPGEQRSVQFSMIERKRAVRVVQQGEVRVEVAPGGVLALESEQYQSECLMLPVPGGSGYKVQVSSWQTQAKAEAVALWASSVSGYSSSVETVQLAGGATRYAVRLGKVSDQEEARMLCDLLAELDRNRQSPLPVAVPPPSIEPEPRDTTTVQPAIRFLSPERVKELLKKSGEKKK